MKLSGQDRLLVIQPLVGIGDMLWHKPWLDQLIDLNPDIILAVKPSSQAHHLFNHDLPPDRFFFIHRNIRGQSGRHDGLIGKLRLSQDLRQLKAQRALILHHSQSYYWLAKMAGIRNIGGFGYGKNNYSTATLSPDDRHIHSLEKMPKFWSLNQWQQPSGGWRINLSYDAKNSAKRWLIDQNIPPHQFIALGIGAMHPDRVWPYERFSELITLIRKSRPDLTPVIIGGNDERAIADHIQSQLGDNPVAEIFLPFPQALAVLSFAKGYVGNDTSLLNISGVFNVPSLGLFSQSKPFDYVPSIHSLNMIDDQDYGKTKIILSYETTSVFDWVNRQF